MGAAFQPGVVVVHYNEIALKLGHRSIFTARLIENLRRTMKDLGVRHVYARQGRLALRLDDASPEAVVERCLAIPGVANAYPAVEIPPDVESLDRAVEALAETWVPSGSFAVAVKRPNKNFPLDSPAIGARVGSRIASASGAPVDLGSPDEVVRIEITRDAMFVGVGRRDGAGGLPVGTGGRVLLLLSGGIDSPVAGLRMMRRGCRVDAVHFHSVPYLSRRSLDKARTLAALLARGQGNTRLTTIAFGDIQSEIVRSVPRPLRVVLYRRMMMRIATALAKREKIGALVTGDSLGQVASQTLANLSTIEDAADVPVLRPLIGMEKREIADYARAAGTFDVSIVPDEDCCTLFVPKHPATAAKPEQVKRAEEHYDCDGFVARAVDERTFERVEADWSLSPRELADDL